MAESLSEADPRRLPPAAYRRQFVAYITQREFKKLADLLRRTGGQETHFPFFVSYFDIADFDPVLVYTLMNHPALLFPIFDEALITAQSMFLATQSDSFQCCSVKRHAHVRFSCIAPLNLHNKSVISEVRAEDSNRLIQLPATVVRTGAVRLLEVSKMFECSKCSYKFQVCADAEQENMLPQPRVCPSSKMKIGLSGSSCDFGLGVDDDITDTGDRSEKDGSASTKICTSTDLREVPGSKECVDYQEIKLQDLMEGLALGAMPRSIVVVLKADLVDRLNPGDDVIVIGWVVRQWRPAVRGCRCVIDIVVHANNVRVVNVSDNEPFAHDNGQRQEQFSRFWEKHRSSPLRGRDLIVRSVCPQLWGMYLVKLCVLLTVIGGSPQVDIVQASRKKRNQSSLEEKVATESTTREDNSKSHLSHAVRRRSQSHLLLVGDPGCGKSQLLRFAASLVARSVVTTGIGTSGAGLTCSAVREGNEWSLEAGALVLANGGVCCIDEFASIKPQDRATIHEAMEQQSISVAKAGLVVSLQTKCSIIACCNPKGNYDLSADMTTNTAIASPLLSRFDLVLVLIDHPRKEWDKRVSTFLLLRAVSLAPPDAIHGGKVKGADENATVMKRQRGAQIDVTGACVSTDDSWSLSVLREYLAYVKSQFHPTIGVEAQAILTRYYHVQRQNDAHSSSRTTVRLLESLMRLSEAHARLMSRYEVLICDAVVAVYCVSLSQNQSSLLDTTCTLQSDFPDNPENAYAEMEGHVLELLKYPDTKTLVAAARRKVPSDSVNEDDVVSGGDGISDEMSEAEEPKKSLWNQDHPSSPFCPFPTVGVDLDYSHAYPTHTTAHGKINGANSSNQQAELHKISALGEHMRPQDKRSARYKASLAVNGPAVAFKGPSVSRVIASTQASTLISQDLPSESRFEIKKGHYAQTHSQGHLQGGAFITGDRAHSHYNVGGLDSSKSPPEHLISAVITSKNENRIVGPSLSGLTDRLDLAGYMDTHSDPSLQPMTSTVAYDADEDW